MRLVDVDKIGMNGRGHFLSLASRAMRCILIDHARRRKAQKRGGENERVPLDAVVDAFEERSADLVALGDALDALEVQDERLARVVELRFFGGLAMDEVADTLDVSKATAERSWRLARIWLRARLDPESRAAGD
jgi:RNA polymerase sigma factor (TIGR02999 family)